MGETQSQEQKINGDGCDLQENSGKLLVDDPLQASEYTRAKYSGTRPSTGQSLAEGNSNAYYLAVPSNQSPLETDRAKITKLFEKEQNSYTPV